jgi:hypothetical protein
LKICFARPAFVILFCPGPAGSNARGSGAAEHYDGQNSLAHLQIRDGMSLAHIIYHAFRRARTASIDRDVAVDRGTASMSAFPPLTIDGRAKARLKLWLARL